MEKAETKAENLRKTRAESVAERNESLRNMRNLCLEFFGTEKMPADLVREFGEIKQLIAREVEGREYLDGMAEFDEAVDILLLKIAKYREVSEGLIDPERLKSIRHSEDGVIEYSFDDEVVKAVRFEGAERELRQIGRAHV